MNSEFTIKTKLLLLLLFSAELLITEFNFDWNKNNSSSSYLTWLGDETHPLSIPKYSKCKADLKEEWTDHIISFHWLDKQRESLVAPFHKDQGLCYFLQQYLVVKNNTRRYPMKIKLQLCCSEISPKSQNELCHNKCADSAFVWNLLQNVS